jgi:signal transduction histidine kinase
MENSNNTTRFIEGGLWLIKLRWIAIICIFVATKFSASILHVTIQEIPLYILAFILFLFNLISLFSLKTIIRTNISSKIFNSKIILFFQIYSDLLILTCLLHFSGGVENPFIIYYIFHMIISSILLTPKECYVITSFTLSFIGALAFLEYQGIIPHYALNGFYTHSFYHNKIYLMGTGVIFITTSYMVIYMTTAISSRLRKQEEAYRLANIELENKDTIKNEYVLRLTHDIKSHIAAIQNILQASLISKSEEERRDFVNQAFKRNRSLMNFTKDLLKLTSLRLQNKLEMKEFSINEAINKVVQELQVSYSEKKIEIHTNLTDSTELINGNQLSIEEALNNIISNAIKYSPEGTIIDIRTEKHKDSYIIEVVDSGIGIPKNELKFVFNEFYRASNVSRIERNSSGFGLSLVKQIIEKHHGKIDIESELNAGTKVTLRLPFRQYEKKKTLSKKWF